MTIQKIPIHCTDGTMSQAWAVVENGLAFHQFHPSPDKEHLYLHSWGISHAASGFAIHQAEISPRNLRRLRWMFRCLARFPWDTWTAIQILAYEREWRRLIYRLHKHWRRKEGRR